jgi:hypothetical protein
MTYFADLTPYEYSNDPAVEPDSPRIVNVGWLSSSHEFPTGEVTPEFVDSLLHSTFETVHAMRGFHHCEFCDQRSPIDVESSDGTRRGVLGMSEIRVQSVDGTTAFDAPSLIYHYVTAHQYLPPREFRDAIVASHSCTL